MTRYSLNLDSRYNIFRCKWKNTLGRLVIDFRTSVGANFHYAFEHGYWFLAPEDEIVDKYYTSIKLEDPVATRDNFPYIAVRIYPFLNATSLMPCTHRMESSTIGCFLCPNR